MAAGGRDAGWNITIHSTNAAARRLRAIYASHILGIPFIPFKRHAPMTPLLIIDTATESGRTLRKASAYYTATWHEVLAVYHEPPRVAFWYEAAKPQRYCHERMAA